MLQKENNTITVAELKAYLYSLEKEQEKEKNKKVNEYKTKCNTNMSKVKKREVLKIQKTIDKEYASKLKVRDEILKLIKDLQEIPSFIERLKITEYMLYRVDLRKAEKVVNKASKRFSNKYDDIIKDIKERLETFSALAEVKNIDYSEYSTNGENLEKAKEQYRLELTEEERNALIEKEIGIIDKAIQFNSIPIPHEVLRTSDKDIQSKMQKFNTIRQKRIRILSTMKQDYQKLLDPREIENVIDDAVSNVKSVKNILTKSEYTSVKNSLNRKRRKVFRSTNEIRNIIETKERKTGIESFNIQEARYLRMEFLRNIIVEATNLIRENPIEETEEQLQKLKVSYEREKQFASVIENLNNGRGRSKH